VIDDWIELLEYVFGFWMFIFSASYRKGKIAKWRHHLTRPMGWIVVPTEVFGGIAGGVIPFGVVFWLMTSN